MEDQPITSPDPEAERDAVYGPFQPPPRRFPKLALAGGIAAAVALGGTGFAYAATSGGSSQGTPAAATSPSTSTPSSTPDGPPKAHHGLRFGGAGFGIPGIGGGRVLYGQATIQQPDGTVKTVEFQSGSVSDVSSGSITVASGTYSHTYKVVPSTVVDAQAGGIGSVAKGDEVRLLATQQNGSDTAVNIVDLTKVQSSRSGFGFGEGKKGAGGSGGSNGTTTNPPAGSTGAIWGGGFGGSGGPGDPGFGPAELQ